MHLALEFRESLRVIKNRGVSTAKNDSLFQFAPEARFHALNHGVSFPASAKSVFKKEVMRFVGFDPFKTERKSVAFERQERGRFVPTARGISRRRGLSSATASNVKGESWVSST